MMNLIIVMHTSDVMWLILFHINRRQKCFPQRIEVHHRGFPSVTQYNNSFPIFKDMYCSDLSSVAGGLGSVLLVLVLCSGTFLILKKRKRKSGTGNYLFVIIKSYFKCLSCFDFSLFSWSLQFYFSKMCSTIQRWVIKSLPVDDQKYMLHYCLLMSSE